MSNDSLTVIVTGAGSGLGLAITRAFVERGDRVVMNGRNPKTLQAASAELGRPEQVLTISGDVGVPSDRARIVEGALESFGTIDVLVNNAGLFSPRPFLEVDEAELDRFLTTNLKGTFFLSQAVIPHMVRAGGGSIVNIGTVLVDHALGGVPVTAPIVSKGAIHALTAQLAAEFGKANVRVNTVAPGIIRTPIHARNGIEDVDSLAGLHLLDRVGEPESIAQATVAVAINSFISGAVIPVDGGHVAGHHLG